MGATNLKVGEHRGKVSVTLAATADAAVLEPPPPPSASSDCSTTSSTSDDPITAFVEAVRGYGRLNSAGATVEDVLEGAPGPDAPDWLLELPDHQIRGDNVDGIKWKTDVVFYFQ